MKSGVVTKCDRIVTAVTFFKKEVVPTTDKEERGRCDGRQGGRVEEDLPQ